MNKLFVFIIFLLFSCNQKKKNAKISVSNESINFGTIKIKDSVSFTTYIKNIGTESVEIVNVGVECNCTSTILKNKTILPNDSIPLEISYNNAKSSDVDSFKKSVVIRSNAKETFKVIRIFGKIVPYIEVPKK